VLVGPNGEHAAKSGSTTQICSRCLHFKIGHCASSHPFRDDATLAHFVEG